MYEVIMKGEKKENRGRDNRDSSPFLHIHVVPAEDGATSPTFVSVQVQPVHHSAINTRSRRAPAPPRNRALNDDEISSALCFIGSESESSSDEEDESEAPLPVRIPRAVQMFFEDTDEATPNAEVDLQWPPPVAIEPPTPSRPSTPAPAADLQPSPDEELPGPSDRFNFDWHAFPSSPVPPELRRETFHGPSGPTASYETPYDAFTAIWDMEIMSKIAKETNDYAQVLILIMIKENKLFPNSRIQKWSDTNPDELYRYFGIILAMGVVYKTRLEEYWNTSQDIFSTPHFRTIMTIDRFLLLSRCLHFTPARSSGLELLTSAEAKLYKVTPIIDHLNSKFATLYNLGQNIALDESLTMWKGWLDINQIIGTKAASIGIKTYEVCESRTGYLWRFEVHARHDPPIAEGPLSGTIPTLVLRLLNGLEHRGHTVWMDNFYNSPALARELKSLGFDCVGTLRTDRQLVPTELAKLTKLQMVPGQVVGCTSGDVDLLVWRDKNRVALISTYHGVATAKCNDTTKPTVVHDYNICMGGVDRKDQMLAMYLIERKRTHIWYKKFNKRLLNVSVLNAYILYKANHTITHRNFRKTLIKQINEKHFKTPIAAPPPEQPELKHFPAQYAEVAQSGPRLKDQRHRARCRVCKKRVSSYCQACNVPLCVFGCFSEFVHK